MSLSIAELGPISRLVARIGKAMAPAMSDLDAQAEITILDIGLSRKAPRETLAFPPMLLLANSVTALGFAAIALESFPSVLVMAWAMAAVFVSLLPMAISSLRNRSSVFASHSRIRLHEFCTVALGLVWAAFPALFIDAASAEVRIIAIAITFAISGIGSLALARVQSSAILFCALIAGSLTLASVKIGGTAGLALGAFSILHGIAVAGMILHAHQVARQRAAAEMEVKKQNEIIALLLNDFSDDRSDWLWETANDGRLTYASRGLTAGLEIPHDALIGKQLEDIFAPLGDAPGWHELQSAIFRRKPLELATVELPFARGKTWWEITGRPMFDSDENFLGYRGVAHDITAEHRNNQQLLQDKEAAERSSATKSQFLAVMSHELRTPLNAIIGFSELLGSPLSENLNAEARADHLRTIREAGQHLQSLINDILDATRIERGTMKLVEQETDAAELVEVAVKMCREAAERSDNTVVARIVDGVEVRGDMTRLKQVLINLITNALKFSPAGGFVNVSFERTEGGGLAVAVRDDGVGIRKEDLGRIFEPYVQADEGMARRFGGAGLGLAIAKKIATLHGGDVTIESQYGSGTTARLVFPAWRVTWPAAQSATATKAA